MRSRHLTKKGSIRAYFKVCMLDDCVKSDLCLYTHTTKEILLSVFNRLQLKHSSMASLGIRSWWGFSGKAFCLKKSGPCKVLQVCFSLEQSKTERLACHWSVRPERRPGWTLMGWQDLQRSKTKQNCAANNSWHSSSKTRNYRLTKFRPKETSGFLPYKAIGYGQTLQSRLGIPSWSRQRRFVHPDQYSRKVSWGRSPPGPARVPHP